MKNITVACLGLSRTQVVKIVDRDYSTLSFINHITITATPVGHDAQPTQTASPADSDSGDLNKEQNASFLPDYYYCCC